MPTDDIQIQVAGTAPVPLSYRIPGNGQLRPKAINATFDGTGAAGAFLPTVEIVSDGGVVVARCPAASVAAGGSAEVSWFPGVAAQQAAAATGAVVSAQVNRGAVDTFGPSAAHLCHFSFPAIITNDPATFTQPNNHAIQLAHGGMIRCDVAGTFGANGGVAYAGVMDIFLQLQDSGANVVNELTGPPVYFAELYATNPGDTFFVSGTDTFNADDTFFTPPYTLEMFIEVSQNVTFVSYGLVVSILNPVGLT